MEDNTTERIKQEDKKGIKKFIIFLIGCFLVGMAGGFLTSMFAFRGEGLRQTLETIGEKILIMAPYVYVAFVVIMIAVLTVVIQKHKKIALLWDGDDEEYIEKAEHRLSIDLSIVEMSNIASFLLGAVALYQMIDRGMVHTLLALISLLGYSFFSIAMERTIVNLIKEMNPEKRGSVFSTSFQKEWLESCDEAEILEQGKASSKAFRTMQITCVALVVFLVMFGMTQPIGLLPVISVGIVWSATCLTYFIECDKKRK